MLFDETRSRQMIGLSKDLAESNPEEYKRGLIQAVNLHTKRGMAAIKFLTRQGYFDLAKVSINPSMWMSSARGKGSIQLGVGNMPDDMKERGIFLDGDFNYEKLVTYRFQHELSHFLSVLSAGMETSVAEAYNKLYEGFVQKLRAGRANMGLTPWGGLEFYKQKGPAEQAKEDMVELTNMYLWDPEYLKAYVSFLSNSKFAGERIRLKLNTLTTESADNVARIIRECIEAVLKL